MKIRFVVIDRGKIRVADHSPALDKGDDKEEEDGLSGNDLS